MKKSSHHNNQYFEILETMVLVSPPLPFGYVIAIISNHWWFLQPDGEGDSILKGKFEAVVDGGACNRDQQG